MKNLYVSIVGCKVVDDKLLEYTIEDRVWVRDPNTRKDIPTRRKREYEVKYNSDSYEAWCVCKLMESSRIICRHIIAVFEKNDVEEVHDMFILRRWRKDSLIRLDALAKKVRADKKENKRCVRLAGMAHEYVAQQTELIIVERQHALDELSIKLNERTEQYRTSLKTILEKEAIISSLEQEKKGLEESSSKRVEEEVAKRMEQARISIRAEVAQEFQAQLDTSHSQLQHANTRISELEEEVKKTKEVVEQWKEMSIKSYEEGECSMRAKNCECLGTGGLRHSLHILP
ncbi:Protein FAR1-RELATED SEQUENCE 6 [Bienertia sinuspersici]